MKRKIKLEIIIPIIIAIILVAVFVYLDYLKQEEEIRPEIPWTVTEKPISKDENPRRSEDLVQISIEKGIDYGCGGPGSMNLINVKQADSVWKIDKKARTVSLGRYRIAPPQYTVLDIPKLWLYFISDTLSNRDDKWYGLEKSYVSKMVLMVNGHEREIRLGGDEYMLIELPDYPLGDYYPYEDMDLEFEVLIELKCSNFKKGIFRKTICYDNQGKPLNYINNAHIQAKIRVFFVGCQDFTWDIIADANFQYEK